MSWWSAGIDRWRRWWKKLFPVVHVTEIGVSMHHYMHDEDSRESDEMVAAALDRFDGNSKDMKWYRTDFYWDQNTDAPHANNAAFLAEVHRRGKKVLFIIDWWGFNHVTLSAVLNDPRLIREHVQAMLNACPDADAWEIWNEINVETFKVPGTLLDGNIDNYVEFLRICYEEIKAAQPNTPVIVGGLSAWGDWTTLTWYTNFKVAGGTAYCDAVGIHPYFSESDNRIKCCQDIGTITGKPVWATETGYPSSGGPTLPVFSDENQVRAVNQYMTDIAPYCDVVLWYTMMDYTTRVDPSTGADPENHYGLLRADYTPKPSWYAFTETPYGPVIPTTIILLSMAGFMMLSVAYVGLGGNLSRDLEALGIIRLKDFVW